MRRATLVAAWCGIASLLGGYAEGIISTSYGMGIDAAIGRPGVPAAPRVSLGVHTVGVLLPGLVAGISGAVGLWSTSDGVGWQVNSGARVDLGYEILPSGPLSIIPVAGLGVGWRVSDGSALIGVTGYLGVWAGVRFSDSKILSLCPAIRVSYDTAGWEAAVGVTARLRHGERIEGRASPEPEVVQERPPSVTPVVEPAAQDLQIRIPSITFPPDSADLDEKSREILQSLVGILTRHPEYSIRIEGHANNLSWAEPERARREEKTELVPLSRARAQAVKDALVELGLGAGRIEVRGMGGSDPVVDFSDGENRWKNRRVEFVLVKSP